MLKIRSLEPFLSSLRLIILTYEKEKSQGREHYLHECLSFVVNFALKGIQNSILAHDFEYGRSIMDPKYGCHSLCPKHSVEQSQST